MKTLISTVAAGCLLLSAAGCSQQTTAAIETRTSAPRKLQVELTTAAIKPLAVSSEFTGNLLPRRRTIVVSEVDGIVREIPAVGAKIDVEVNGTRYIEQLGINYGHEVKPGDVLVKLDTVDFELELMSSKAKLAKAEADLADLKAWERPETIARLTAVRDEAKARHDQAISELERATGLGGAISKSELDARPHRRRDHIGHARQPRGITSHRNGRPDARRVGGATSVGRSSPSRVAAKGTEPYQSHNPRPV